MAVYFKRKGKKMNIKQNLNFNSEKPAVFSVIKNDKLNLFAIGLQKGQTLSNHKAVYPSFLTVLEGNIILSISENKIELYQFDTYDIPTNTVHEVTAKEQSFFTLTQPK